MDFIKVPLHNWGQKLYRFSHNFIQFAALGLTGLLWLSAFLWTCYAQNMTTQEVLTRWDVPVYGLLFLIFSLGIFYLITKWMSDCAARLKSLFLFLVLLWILSLGGLLILFGRTAPAADAWSVYSAAVALADSDTSVIHPTLSYLSYYPQQIGLVAFFELCVRIWKLFGIPLEAYHFIKCLYIIFTCVIVYFQYKTVHLLWENDIADIAYLLLAGCNFPLIMYSSFVYGEVPSFTALSVGLYFFIGLIKKQGKASLCTTASLLAFTLSVLLRKNSLILIIAIIIVVWLEALEQKRKLLLVYGLACMILALNILPFTRFCYEKRAGNHLQSGVPAMSYFAMGMQESSRGNGWYNGFNFNTYEESGMDTEVTVQISKAYIRERMTYFKEHPGYAVSFYFNKYLSQWADGTYASRQATLATLGERHPLVKELYDGSYSPFYIAYCNGYQNLLYLSVFLYFLIGFHKKNSHKLYPYVGFIGVLGGFLFHMIWEANARYIFLYSLLLLPYGAQGLSLFFEAISNNTSVPGKYRKNK